MKTNELLSLLQRHYIKPSTPLPGGIFLPEVGWNNGSGKGGCDAVYVGFTGSSGRILVGHELKVSRADWLNELNKPGKADAWADQCHEWWVVVADPSIVLDGELPDAWGLMSPGTSKTRMKIHRAASRKGDDHTPSWLAVRSIMARQDTLRANTINVQFQEAHRKAQVIAEAEIERRVAMRQGPVDDDLRERLRLIEQAVGGRIVQNVPYDGQVGLDDLAELASAARTYGDLRRALGTISQRYNDPMRQLHDLVKNLDRTLKDLKEA